MNKVSRILERDDGKLDEIESDLKKWDRQNPQSKAEYAKGKTMHRTGNLMELGACSIPAGAVVAAPRIGEAHDLEPALFFGMAGAVGVMGTSLFAYGLGKGVADKGKEKIKQVEETGSYKLFKGKEDKIEKFLDSSTVRSTEFNDEDISDYMETYEDLEDPLYQGIGVEVNDFELQAYDSEDNVLEIKGTLEEEAKQIYHSL